ncbi:MAG: pyridoxal 5'-phosphate synthase glutaminase subunit PdxT [Methanotrichaceae archaeon]
MTKIGVIAFQGDVSEHIKAMERALDGKGSVVPVRHADVILECDGLVLPGGESTAISKQMKSSGMRDELKASADAGTPILATCAGLVLVSREIEGDSMVEPLGLMNIKIGRNAFGSQRESFEADLDIKGFDKLYHAVFIRAPAIVDAGKDVDVLAHFDRFIVAARQKNIICLAFHPELVDDMRFHKTFLKMVEA